MEDRYQVITSRSEGEYKEKGSKFIAYAFPVVDEKEVQEALLEIKELHPKSRHYCYAYRMGLDGKLFRTNDDGEPSGTAGKPIHGQLLSHNVSDALVVVIRYFGGTKLGASGLINAYKTSAKLALDNVSKEIKVLKDRFQIKFDYESMGKVMNDIKSMNFDIIEKQFEEEAVVLIDIPKNDVEEQIQKFKAILLRVSTEQITDETEIDFCTIEKLQSW